MENFEEISLGKKGWFFKNGSLLTLIFMIIVILFIFRKITIQEYKDVQILSTKSNLYMTSKIDLPAVTSIRLANNSILIFKLHKIDKGTYQIIPLKANNKDMVYLRMNIISLGKVFLKKKSLLDSII